MDTFECMVSKLNVREFSMRDILSERKEKKNEKITILSVVTLE
jgi:hypothetical protein